MTISKRIFLGLGLPLIIALGFCNNINKGENKDLVKSVMSIMQSQHYAPIANAKRLDTSGTTTSNSESGGYSIMQADNVAKIEELLKQNPHLQWGEGCYIEIHEKMPLPKC